MGHDKFIIGVDGGGTGCRAVISDAHGAILAQGAAGPANVTTDQSGAIRSVQKAVQTAADNAGIDATLLANATAHIGLAGVMSDAQSRAVAAALGFGVVHVTDDQPTTVAGALAGQDGCVMAIGTGSFAARLRAGQITYVGGWGLSVSDQASGAWLGRGVLEQVLLGHDGLVAHSALTRQVFARFDNDPKAIVAFCSTARPVDYAQLAPLVLDADADHVADQLLTQGAQYLERALAALGHQAGDAVCLCGGVGPAYARYLSVEVTPPQGTALDGALFLARRIAQ